MPLRLLEAAVTKAFSHAVDDSSVARKGHENEEALQSVEANEDIPHSLDVDKAGSQPRDPRQAHDDGQADVQLKIDARGRATWGHFGGGVGRVVDKASAEDKKEDVEAHYTCSWEK